MYKRILLAVDVQDAENSARTANVAARMAAAEGAELHVVNVVPDTGMAIVGSHLSAAQMKAVMAEAKAQLASWAKTAVPDLAAANLHAVRGTIYDRILKTATEIGADLIVIGAHSPELRDYLIGPNAGRVVRHAQQSVFVVR